MSYTFRAAPLVYRGEFVQAAPWCERAVQLCEAKGLLGWLPTAYSDWGWVLAWSGKAGEALRYLEQGATLHENLGGRTHLSLRYFQWAAGHLLAGQIDEAERMAERARELAAALSERGHEAEALHLLGDICAAEEPPDLEAALAHYERAQARAEQLGMRPLLARCHLALGKLHRRTGERRQAEERLLSARNLLGEMGMRFWLAQAVAELGELP